MPDAAPDPSKSAFFEIYRSQAIRIRVEFELPGADAVIGRDGDRLMIEPVHQSKILDVLAVWEPLDDEYPDMDAGLPPLRDVTL